jgi:hypothetical protein
MLLSTDRDRRIKGGDQLRIRRDIVSKSKDYGFAYCEVAREEDVSAVSQPDLVRAVWNSVLNWYCTSILYNYHSTIGLVPVRHHQYLVLVVALPLQ